MNIDFIKKVLMSTAEYWIVAKARRYSEGLTIKRDTDDIMLIAIPKDIKRGLRYEEITLQEVEKLSCSYVEQNISINSDYSPFQNFIQFNGIYSGYPVEYNVKEFMIKALQLKSNDIHDYKDLIETKPE